MPRKAYNADLAEALTTSFPNIDNVTAMSDGEFTFEFKSGTDTVLITVMIPEVADYPSEHEVMTFGADNAPAWVAGLLGDTPRLFGKTVSQILTILSRSLSRISDGGDHELDDDGDLGMSDYESVGEASDFDPSDGEMEARDGFGNSPEPETRHVPSHSQQVSPLSLIRNDMLVAKAAGFKIGHIGKFSSHGKCTFAISCKITKLGISEEALNTWSINEDDYLILLIQYKQRYKPLKELLTGGGFTNVRQVEFRTGLCNKYKPSPLEVQEIFEMSAGKKVEKPESVASNQAGLEFRPTFISRPLDGLLNDRLLPIIKYRVNQGMTWGQAENYFNSSQGKYKASSSFGTYLGDYESTNQALPTLVTDDELLGHNGSLELSFPLISMQFMLRHFVRCTEFCLVCHTKIDSDVEAIKPYVCDKPLCLFQYMSLGFGPAIEPEILSQPYVVDLLVSFCYAAARQDGIRTYPQGLSMMVPNPRYAIKGIKGADGYPANVTNPEVVSYGVHSGTFDPTGNEIEIRTADSHVNLKPGDWLAINSISGTCSWHGRVVESKYYPIVKLDSPIMIDLESKPSKKAEDALDFKPTEVSFQVYDTNFDELVDAHRSAAMALLINLLPSVNEMTKYLKNGKNVSLSNWVTRMPPAALTLLRWIIASNRSCIMQVDKPQLDGEVAAVAKGEERIQGLKNWMQFRFAMGAPDKEQRFINAIKDTTKSLPYPTLFAFHGSRLKNWHNIIREGLHFKDTVNGRAYGHGVYHSPQFTVSSGYGGYYTSSSTPQYGAEIWPQSALKFNSSIALSEIVNAPDKFVSKSPHYVVQHLDWIQTRYLFVRPATPIQLADEHKLSEVLPQDPSKVPTGPEGGKLVLPVTAVPTSRRPRENAVSDLAPKPKRTKLSSLFGTIGKIGHADHNADDLSDATDDEDLSFLTEVEHTAVKPSVDKPQTQAKKPSKPAEPVLPFTPGPVENLALLPPPSFATPVASKSLQRDFQTLLRVQDKHTEEGLLHELGWYTDPEHMSATGNLYQWIVCLHSFPMTLPLAKDMKERNISSVVLEMRFPADYPISPPFLRVITPRFLPFSQGGGGHVTAGGSICMELLTNSGWSAVSSIESVLLQVRMAIMNLEPKPARLIKGGSQYGIGEAIDAYKRVASLHGWKIPPGIDATARAHEIVEQKW